jgi:hypothetical protein
MQRATTPTSWPEAAPPDATDRLVRRIVWLAFIVASAALWWPVDASATRVREVASVAGVRSNQLTGYGLVVGLDGSGDQTTAAPFTTQSLISMLQQLGVTIPPGTPLALRNVAAVMVTATLPPYAMPGQVVDVNVSSIGNAKSLRGGTLVTTPLKGVDGQIYALAQGNLVIGGAGASANGSKVVINQLSSRCPIARSTATRCSWPCMPATTRPPAPSRRPSTTPRGRAPPPPSTDAWSGSACRSSRTGAWPSWPTSRTCRCSWPSRRPR